YYLPKELKSNDILDPAGLDIDYDIDQACYYVHGTISLAPKESKLLKIQVKDVWFITQEQVDAIKKQLDQNLAFVANTSAYEPGKARRDKLNNDLNYILAQQE